MGDQEAAVAELFLFGHAFAVGGEVSEQVGPAELALGGVEVVVAAPAVRADDPGEALAEQRPGLEGVAAGRDPEDRGPAGEGAPECPVAAGGLPAGLVDVDDRGRLDPLLELRVGAGERLPGALDDLVDRPGRELDAEQLPGELGRVAARDTVPDRERHDRGLQPRPERRPRLAGKLGPRPGRALRAADTVQPMLGHPDRDRRQLGDLVPPRLRGVDELRLAEHVRARPAALGPMLDDLVDLLGRKQPSVLALMPGLATPPSTRPLPARPRRRRRRILRRRQRRVPRTPVQPPLELSHASLEPLIRLDQLAQPQQQHDSRLTITIKDRLGLSPLHTTRFAAATEVPLRG